MDDQERRDDGMAQRRKVLGNAWVDKSIAGKNSFNADFIDLITRYAWGEIWTRPELPRNTRSMITLAMLIALNRGDEFRLHVRGALNNGVTAEEIAEILLHAAVYAGIPIASEGFRRADKVIADVAAEKKTSP